MSDSMWDHYRTGPCVTALHPLCAGGRCTCECHQPAQPPATGVLMVGGQEYLDEDEARRLGALAPEEPPRAEGFTSRCPVCGQAGRCPHAAERRARRAVDTVTVVLSLSDYRFATEYDPERERSASRRDMVTVLEEIQALLRDNRMED